MKLIKKSKFLIKTTIIATSLLLLSGCQSFKEAGNWVVDQVAQGVEYLLNTNTIIKQDVENFKLSMNKSAVRLILCQEKLLKAQGHADKAKEYEAILETLQSSPTSDSDAISTAIEKSKAIEVDYTQKINISQEEVNEYEKQAFIASMDASRALLEAMQYMGIISEKVRARQEMLKRARARGREQEFYDREPPFTDIAITAQEISCLPYLLHTRYIAVTLYKVGKYAMNQGGVKSEEKAAIEAVFADLDYELEKNNKYIEEVKASEDSSKK